MLVRFGGLALSMLPARQRLHLSDLEVSALRPVRVDCETDVRCARRRLQYSVVMAECPALEVALAYDWRIVGGRSPADHHLHRAASPGRAEHEPVVPHDAFRSTELRLGVRVDFGGASADAASAWADAVRVCSGAGPTVCVCAGGGGTSR